MEASEFTSLRRVVTGVVAGGRSAVVYDGPITAWIGDTHGQVWSTSGIPVDNATNDDGARTDMRLVMPPAGTRFWIGRYPPGFGTDPSTVPLIAEAIEGLGGLVGDNPALHRTHTVDFMVVLDGEIVLLLDEGEVTLRRFDSLVVRGVSHGWENRAATDAVLAIFMVEALAPEARA